jgi:hypothetical protein
MITIDIDYRVSIMSIMLEIRQREKHIIYDYFIIIQIYSAHFKL